MLLPNLDEISRGWDYIRDRDQDADPGIFEVILIIDGWGHCTKFANNFRSCSSSLCFLRMGCLSSSKPLDVGADPNQDQDSGFFSGILPLRVCECFQL